MTIEEQLNQTVNQWNLLDNPFYAAWSAGTLPKHALQTYASEYDNFIALLPIGWNTLNDKETAHEEIEHHNLWQQFTKSLKARAIPAQLPETKALMKIAQTLFSNKATAIGAMYAFEVQQPKTAQSKKQGLQTHYAHFHADEAYFDIHSHNEHEAEKLLTRMEALSPDEQKKAMEACAIMSKALWDALASIHKTCMCTS